MSNTTRKNDIDALIAQIKSQYAEIKTLYNVSLQDKEIKPILKIKVKNYLENARSALDYCAHDIADVYEIIAQNIYFPIIAKDKDRNSFDGAIGRNLPNLKLKNEKIFDYLESIQPYHTNYSWLADFSFISGDIKHSELTPQTRTETQRIASIHSDGRKVSWNPNMAKFGSGVCINNAPVNQLTQMPVSTPETTITKEIWIDFKFKNVISALPLMKKVHDEVPKIINEIYVLLSK